MLRLVSIGRLCCEQYRFAPSRNYSYLAAAVRPQHASQKNYSVFRYSRKNSSMVHIFKFVNMLHVVQISIKSGDQGDPM